MAPPAVVLAFWQMPFWRSVPYPCAENLTDLCKYTTEHLLSPADRKVITRAFKSLWLNPIWKAVCFKRFTVRSELLLWLGFFQVGWRCGETEPSRNDVPPARCFSHLLVPLQVHGDPLQRSLFHQACFILPGGMRWIDWGSAVNQRQAFR